MAAKKKMAASRKGPSAAAGIETTPELAGAQAATDLVSRTPAELVVPDVSPPNTTTVAALPIVQDIMGRVKLTPAMVKIVNPASTDVRHVDGETHVGTPAQLRALALVFEQAAPTLGFGVRQAATGAAIRLHAAAQHAIDKASRKADRKPGTTTPAKPAAPKPPMTAGAAAKAVGSAKIQPMAKATSILALAQDVDKHYAAYVAAKARLQAAL